MALRWGIAGAGSVSHDFASVVDTLSSDEHKIVAVGARDLGRATEFAERFNIPTAYGSYLELARDPNIEVIYIGVLNHKHLEVSLLMLEHNKHVLCEKPMCLNEKQVCQLVLFANQKNLFLLEGIWSRFFPSYKYIREQIESGKLGEIERIEAEYGNKFMGELDRINKKELGGGTVLDVGVYTIQFCQFIFQKEPKSIKATGRLNDQGVDLEMSAELRYDDGKVAKMKTTALYTPSNTAKIYGTKGSMTVPILNCPTTILDVDGTEKSWPLPKTKHKLTSTNISGLRYELDEVRKCIRAGKTESELVTNNESLIIARIEDEIRRQIGVKYAEDD